MTSKDELEAWKLMLDKLEHDDWSHVGLCYEIKVLEIRRIISYELGEKMSRRVDNIRFSRGLTIGSYLFPVGEIVPRINLVKGIISFLEGCAKMDLKEKKEKVNVDS